MEMESDLFDESSNGEHCQTLGSLQTSPMLPPDSASTELKHEPEASVGISSESDNTVLPSPTPQLLQSDTHTEPDTTITLSCNREKDTNAKRKTF